MVAMVSETFPGWYDQGVGKPQSQYEKQRNEADFLTDLGINLSSPESDVFLRYTTQDL